MKYAILLLFALYIQDSIGQELPEVNVIYGSRHIFTVNTPVGWVNDREAATKIGLVSFFYAQSEVTKEPRSYMYAMGYDKDANNKNLRSFVNGDITTFENKYPNLTYCISKMGKSDGIIDATMLTFSNLNDRFKEEVIYLETEFSILVFIFASFNESDYRNYRPAFDQLMSSFNYRGSNPQKFLDSETGKN